MRIISCWSLLLFLLICLNHVLCALMVNNWLSEFALMSINQFTYLLLSFQVTTMTWISSIRNGIQARYFRATTKGKLLTRRHFQWMPGGITPPHGVNVRAVSIRPVVIFMVPSFKMNQLKGIWGITVLWLVFHVSFLKICKNKYTRLKLKWH